MAFMFMASLHRCIQGGGGSRRETRMPPPKTPLQTDWLVVKAPKLWLTLPPKPAHSPPPQSEGVARQTATLQLLYKIWHVALGGAITPNIPNIRYEFSSAVRDGMEAEGGMRGDQKIRTWENDKFTRMNGIYVIRIQGVPQDAHQLNAVPESMAATYFESSSGSLSEDDEIIEPKMGTLNAIKSSLWCCSDNLTSVGNLVTQIAEVYFGSPAVSTIVNSFFLFEIRGKWFSGLADLGIGRYHTVAQFGRIIQSVILLENRWPIPVYRLSFGMEIIFLVIPSVFFPPFSPAQYSNLWLRKNVYSCTCNAGRIRSKLSNSILLNCLLWKVISHILWVTDPKSSHPSHLHPWALLSSEYRVIGCGFESGYCDETTVIAAGLAALSHFRQHSLCPLSDNDLINTLNSLQAPPTTR
ncbi:hypothetical protein ACFE04_000022 [Oxalis oulophora]